MIGVTWLSISPHLASARLRNLIPRDILISKGLVKKGSDLVIASKHGWDVIRVREHFRRMIMDVCDDHFSGKWAQHYHSACKMADLVTCNSKAMQEVIRTHTQIDAVVIDDPYEDPELEPEEGFGILWFGHQTNLPDLKNISDGIKYPVTIVSNHNYSPEMLDASLKACRCVIIPTGYRQAKSANRAIRAIRYGKFPVCGPMPAHEEIGLGLDDFWETLDLAMTTDMRSKVLHLQDVVRDRFHPGKVAKDWYRAISEVT